MFLAWVSPQFNCHLKPGHKGKLQKRCCPVRSQPGLNGRICVFAFTGGLSFFRQSHENLCEHSLQLREGLDSGAAAGLTGTLPHSLPSTPDIENAELTPILPFLYLGNEHDAQDIHLLQRLNIGHILNVTTHLPLYHYDTGLFVYKRLPATDSNKQNLRQYFEEAFEFIGIKGNVASW